MERVNCFYVYMQQMTKQAKGEKKLALLDNTKTELVVAG